MTGLGVGIGRDPAALDAEAIGAEAAERALALVGARQPESRRCPVVLDAFVAASFIGFIGVDAVRRRGPARPLAVRRARGRGGRRPCAPARRRRHRPRGPVERALRRRGRADAPDRADRGRAPARLPVRLAHRAEGGRATTGNASRGSYRTPPSVGHDEPGRRARRAAIWPAWWQRGRRGPLRDRRRRPPFGRQPGVRNLLGGRVRTPDRERRAGQACARDDNRQRPRLDAESGARLWAPRRAGFPSAAA